MKSLVDNIDKRMNSFFIITADVSTTIHIYQCVSQVLSYQQQALSLSAKYPWLIAWAADTESSIVADATDLLGFLSLIVLSYGDLNKISVASRKQIYTELDHQLSKIVLDAQYLVAKLKMVDLAETYKNTPQWQFVNNDKKLADGILGSFKF
jgi:hypothetical protein